MSVLESVGVPVQCSLRVGSVSDPLEVEADRVAERVVGSDSVGVVRRCPGGCPGDEELRRSPTDDGGFEDEEELLLADGGGSGGVVGSEVAAGVGAVRGGGVGLSESVRGFFEPRFGADFSGVRVHADGGAAGLAASVNARAFTVGSDVFFGAGEFRPGTREGDRLLAHELTHTLQQDPDRRTIRRQLAPPVYRDCAPAITGRADANAILEAARQRARSYVAVAMRQLGAAPAAGSTYATAAQRHFITPTAAQRTAIRTTYGQILRELRVRNFICNTGAICGTEQAFWIPQDDLIHVCQPFWTVDRTCQAVILIHEAAHDVGVDIAGAHAPNRGSAAYPTGNTAPPVGQTTAGRIGNGDAYGFFAAHIWRGTDTGRTCF